jgi:hypothetical protein
MEESVQTPSLSESINADGFRRWHEYELTRGFGYLALGVLALVASLAILEGILDTGSPAGKLAKAFLSFCALCLTAWSWQRFINILTRAENLSRQAVCSGCGRYAQLTVTRERCVVIDRTGVLSCRCKKCAFEWEMDYTLESSHE